VLEGGRLAVDVTDKGDGVGIVDCYVVRVGDVVNRWLV